MYRILYVDDEPSLLDIGKLFLEESGDFRVATAPSAAEGIRLLEQEKFDAIISDYQMPGMDGITFLRQLKTAGNKTPFIIFTGRGREEVVIEALNSGADFYIQKGGDPKSQFAELANKIQYAITRKRGEKQLLEKNEELSASYEQIAAAEEELRGQFDMLVKNEKDLRESEERYRLISENTADVIWTLNYKTGKFTYVSQSVQKLRGYTPEEVMTQTMAEALTPESMESVNRLILEGIAKRKPGDASRLITTNLIDQPCKDGSVVSTEVVSTLVFDELGNPVEIFGISRDITERKVAEDALRESESHLSSIFRAAPVGIGVISNRIIKTVNDRLCQMTGYTAEELIGKSSRLLYPTQEDFDYVGREKYALIAQKGSGSVETRWKKKDGTIIDILLSSTPINPSNPAGGVTFTALDITERKMAEKLVRESENKFSSVFHGSPMALTLVSALDGRFVMVNDAFVRATGYTRDEVTGATSEDLGIFADGTEREQLARSLRENRIVEDMEIQCRIKTGEIRPCLFSSAIILIDRKPHILSTVRDITNRKMAEAALFHQSATLSILNGIISTANKADNLPQLLSSILDESLRLLDFDAGGIYLVDGSTRTAHVVHSRNLSKEFLAEIQPLPIDKKPYDTLFIKNEPIITENYATISPDRSKKYGFVSMAGIPLLSKGLVIGALNVASRRRQVISEEERQTLISISRELGSTIERMAAEEEVRKSAKNLETLFNSIDDMVFVLDMQGNILAVNDTVQKRLLYTSEELVGKNVLQLHVPERRDEVLSIVQGMITGTTDSCPVPVLAKDGTCFEVETKVTRGWWNGSEALVGVSRDITVRKRSEEKVRENEERFRTILNSMQFGIVIIDAQTHTIVEANPKALEMIGDTSESVAGQVCHRFICPAELGKCPVTDLLQTVDSSERVLLNLRGEKIPILKSVIKTMLGGKEVLIESFINITDRKLAEDTLQRVNQKLNVLSQLTRHDLTTQIFILNSYLEMAKKQADGQDGIIKNIVSGERTVRLIKEITEFTKDYQNMGEKPPKWQNVKLTFLFGLSHISIGEIRHSLETGNLEIFADPLLEKAFQGLLENSVAHGDHVNEIRVSHTVNTDWVTVVFEDNGIGIPQEKKERIFLRGEGARASVRGLFFVQEILSITGIIIRETGEPGKGARFEMAVPKGVYRITNVK